MYSNLLRFSSLNNRLIFLARSPPANDPMNKKYGPNPIDQPYLNPSANQQSTLINYYSWGHGIPSVSQQNNRVNLNVLSSLQQQQSHIKSSSNVMHFPDEYQVLVISMFHSKWDIIIL